MPMLDHTTNRTKASLRPIAINPYITGKDIFVKTLPPHCRGAYRDVSFYLISIKRRPS